MTGGEQPPPIEVEVGGHSGRVEGWGGKEAVVMGGARFVSDGSEQRGVADDAAGC